MPSGAKVILITPILYDNEVLILRRTINLPIDLAVDTFRLNLTVVAFTAATLEIVFES